MSEHGRGSEIRSGLFVILSVLVFTVLVFSVGRLKSGFTEQVSYETYLTDATGNNVNGGSMGIRNNTGNPLFVRSDGVAGTTNSSIQQRQ